MSVKKFIPNLLTLFNLLSGTIAVFLAVNNYLVEAAIFVFLGILFDFFDGFVARLLNVQGELGKQLDSLADVVTSGVVPGIVMFQLIKSTVAEQSWSSGFIEAQNVTDFLNESTFVGLLGLLITLGAAYRLANFNIDERQSDSFIGLPTPAAALVVLSLPLILTYSSNELVIEILQNTWVLLIITLMLCYLMNAEIHLFSLKFKDFSWKKNKVKYLFILITFVLSALLQFAAIPLLILLYVAASVIENKYLKA